MKTPAAIQNLGKSWSVTQWQIHYALLGVFISAGALLRLTALNRQSLWFDEADVVVRAQQPFSKIFETFVAVGENGPLYNLMLAIWIRMAGISEIAVRFPSAVAGIMALPVLYMFARRVANPQIALFSTGLLAISPYHIWYSQEAKMYSIIVLLGLLSSLLLVESLERNRWPWWAAYTVVTTIMFYTHVASVLIFVAQTGYVLIASSVWRDRERAWLISAALLTLPYLPIALWALKVVGGETPTWQPSVSLTEALRIVFTKFAVNRTEAWIELWGAVLFVSLACAGVVFFIQLKQRKLWIVLLVLLSVLPVIGLYIVSLRNSVFSDRYIIVSLPAFLTLVAAGLFIFLKSRQLWPAGMLLLGLVLVFSWASIRDVNRSFNAEKEDWRSAYADVASRAEPGDVLLIHPGYLLSTYIYHEQREPRLNELGVATIPTFRAPWMTEQLMVESLRTEFGGATRVWLVESPDRVPAEDPDLALENWLRSNGEVIYEHEVNGVNYMLVQLAEPL